MDGMSDVEHLAALADICRLKARRDRAVDTKDWTTYEALHAPDHYSHNDGMPRMDGAANMVRQVSQMMANVTSVHHSHTPDITFESPTRAHGVWSMEDNLFWKQGTEDHWLRGFGYYHETYEKRNGVWVFTSRRLERIHVQTSPGAKLGA
jgi:SnoaL-like domain